MAETKAEYSVYARGSGRNRGQPEHLRAARPTQPSHEVADVSLDKGERVWILGRQAINGPTR
jgi:hypothetical protein